MPRHVEHVRRRARRGVRHGLRGGRQAGDDVGDRRRADHRHRAGHRRRRCTPRLAAAASQYANSVVALDGATLKVRDWVTAASRAFTSTPVVFSEGGRRTSLRHRAAGCTCSTPPRLAAPITGRRCCRDAADCNGLRFDHGQPSRRGATRRARAGFLPGRAVPSPRSRSSDQRRRAVHRRACGHRGTMPSPRTPIVVNGVVFALAGGQRGANAVALCARSCDRQGALEQR